MQEFMYAVRHWRAASAITLAARYSGAPAGMARSDWLPRGAEHRWWGTATEGQVLAHTGELSLGLPARQFSGRF